MNRRPLSGRTSALLTSLLLVAATAPATAQDALLGRNLAATCANCHGSGGVARAAMPALAGVPAATTIAAMAAFKSGSRPATVMHQLAKGYSDEQIRLMAEYFAAQKGRP